MIYNFVITLSSAELASITGKLRIEQRLTKALPKRIPLPRRDPASRHRISPPIVLVVVENDLDGSSQPSRALVWLGVFARHNIVGAVDGSITVDPLRECKEPIPLDGADGLLSHISDRARNEFENASHVGTVGVCWPDTWVDLETALRRKHPTLTNLLDWLIARANPPRLSSSNAADRSWQEQQDAVVTSLRIGDFPPEILAWERPDSEDAPYLSGIIPEPSENSLIEHDIREAGRAFGLFSERQVGGSVRCDIHTLRDSQGRRLEISNVNTTQVESRLGTDMIYYHEPTESLVLVQYKRLDPVKREIYVDQRLRGQLKRLEGVTKLSRHPKKPSEWRFSSDPCFLKLAYWPKETYRQPADSLTSGMYLPVSYVRLLLQDDCTRGPSDQGDARYLGYNRVERHLVNSQFIELVKNGLAGTVGTTREQLNSLALKRVKEGRSLVLAVERSNESVAGRQKRIRSRGARSRRYAHFASGQATLF